MEEDIRKTTIMIEWVSFTYNVMPFKLKNAPTVFSRIAVAIFKKFMHKFLEFYLDSCYVFRLLKEYVHVLRLILERCRQIQVVLNFKNYILCSPFKILFGHVLCKYFLWILEILL